MQPYFFIQVEHVEYNKMSCTEMLPHLPDNPDPVNARVVDHEEWIKGGVIQCGHRVLTMTTNGSMDLVVKNFKLDFKVAIVVFLKGIQCQVE